MLETPHLLVGAACGIMTKDPITACIAGFISHIVLDLLPHHDQTHYLNLKKNNFAVLIITVIDFLLGLTILFFILRNRPSIVIVLAISGASGAFIIDFLDHAIGDFLWKKFKKTKPGRLIRKFHRYFHTHTPANRYILGILTQIFCTTGGIAHLYLY